MNKEDYVIVPPDFVLNLFWVFVTVALLAAIAGITFTVASFILEHYQNRKEDYLRAKKLKLEMKEKWGIEE